MSLNLFDKAFIQHGKIIKKGLGETTSVIFKKGIELFKKVPNIALL